MDTMRKEFEAWATQNLATLDSFHPEMRRALLMLIGAAYERGAAVEREACAKLCDEFEPWVYDGSLEVGGIAERVRRRGEG